jgi:Mn-dependent DtxR family transcriptional regulator
MDKLSFTLESYLDAVYELSAGGEGARLTHIAKRMNVTKSTAGAAMTALAERNLILNERYRHIKLTELGADLAMSVTKKHETIRSFFMEQLHIDEETADADACAIEHVISDKAVSAMRRAIERQI